MKSPAIPSEEDLSRLAWPLLDTARMLRMARLVLTLAGIAEGEAEAIAEHIQRAGGPELSGLAACDELASEINGTRAEVGINGRKGLDVPVSSRLVEAHHVAAVAALLIGGRLLSLQPGMSQLAIALGRMSGAPSGDRLADLKLASLAGKCCSLAADAVFMVGRDEMRSAVEAAEAKLRSDRARMGGAPRQFTDDDLLAFLAEYHSTHSHARGRIKAAANHFDVTDKTISRRLKLLSGKQEPTE